MPYTTPTAGTAITVAYATANIRDQVVTPFATGAAFTSAVTSPVQGMTTHLNDSNALWTHNGTTLKPASRLLIGTKYAISASALATSSSYGTAVAMTAWTGGEANISLPTGFLYRVELEISSKSADNARGVHAITLYKAVNSTATAYTSWNIVGNFYDDAQDWTLRRWLKNVSGSTITTSFGVGVTAVEGGGNSSIWGTSANPCVLTIWQYWPTAELASLTAGAIAIT